MCINVWLEEPCSHPSPSATVLGASGYPVTVEVHVGKGLPGYHIVGMPDTACRESRDRVRAAVMSSGIEWPSHVASRSTSRPAGHRKIGRRARPRHRRRRARRRRRSSPPEAVEGFGFIGELGLDGSLRRVPGRRADGRRARRRRRRSCRSARAPRPTSPRRHGCASRRRSPRCSPRSPARRRGRSTRAGVPAPSDAARGPTSPTSGVSPSPAGRSRSPPPAVTTCCSSGPPGSGKTMLAQRLTGLLPPLDREQALEATMVHSAAGRRDAARRARRASRRSGRRTTPARSVALVGGGSRTLRPGEISHRPRRRALPRRAGRVRARPCSTACASRSRRASSGSSRAASHAVLAGPLPARRRHQPVPVRRRTARGLRVRRDRPAALPAAAVRPAARPLRPPGGGAAPRRRRPARSRRRRAERGRRATGGGGARRRHRAGRDASTPSCTASCSTGTPRSRRAARALLRTEIERGRLTGRGYHRIRRVARTIADLGCADGGRPESTSTRSTSSTSRSRCRCALACGRRRPGWWPDDAVDAAHPTAGHVAALAGFDLMTVARLRVLLAHHDPVEAYAVAAGDARPAPAVARLLTADRAVGVAGVGRPAPTGRVGRPMRRCRHPRRHAARRRVPGPAAPRPAAAGGAVRAR